MRVTCAVTLVMYMLALKPVFGECYHWGVKGQQRFILLSGEALDRRTNLIWKRCSLGTIWSGAKCTGEKLQLGLDDALQRAQLEGNGWRVPTGQELSSLIDPGCGKPVVDKRVFPDVSADIEGAAAYWTTSEAGVASLIYYIDFMDGIVDGHSKGFFLSVRLVKNGT